jgi:DNA-binding NarL/FixJ family response regulator
VASRSTSSSSQRNSIPRVKPVRVVLIEDNDVFRDALGLLFDLRDDITVVASLGDGSEAVGVCASLAPDVAVIDYRLPGLDGVEVAHAIRYACPDVALICLTAEVDEPAARALREAGVGECVTKDEPFEDIVAAIKRAAER